MTRSKKDRKLTMALPIIWVVWASKFHQRACRRTRQPELCPRRTEQGADPHLTLSYPRVWPTVLLGLLRSLDQRSEEKKVAPQKRNYNKQVNRGSFEINEYQEGALRQRRCSCVRKGSNLGSRSCAPPGPPDVGNFSPSRGLKIILALYPGPCFSTSKVL